MEGPTLFMLQASYSLDKILEKRERAGTQQASVKKAIPGLAAGLWQEHTVVAGRVVSV